jgi:endonuclease III
MTDVVLPFPVQPDLAATMDIQIPALAWQPADGGAWRRALRTRGAVTGVTVTADDHALRFSTDSRLSAPVGDALAAGLRRRFPRQVSALSLGGHPVLAEMSRQYGGTILMTASPFEALVLAVLSQNRTGEIVRRVYPRLEARCGGMTPDLLAALSGHDLAEAIRPAGPYKAARLAAAASAISAGGPGLLDRAVTRAPAAQAMAYLTGLPGVGHKTAACVLVFGAQSTATLPVDTHLARVAHRLGLAGQGGTASPARRDAVVAALLRYGPDLAAAHFLFLLLGRATCAAGVPRCGECFLQQPCPSAPARPAPW